MIEVDTLILLYSMVDEKKFFLQINPGRTFSTHHGNVLHNDIAEAGFGATIESHIGKKFLVMRPSLYDIIMNIKRHTQIIYPKDVGYILLKLGLRNGDRVIEAGTGSGALTIAMAYAVLPQGKIHTYERREEFSKKAEKNLIMAGIREYVDMKVRDVGEDGFDEKDVDAIFLDMKDPVDSIAFAFNSLRVGGTLALLLPTTNQISDALRKIEECDFTEVEVLELMIRKYKTVADRIRPEDRMVGHTGYLVFARKKML